MQELTTPNRRILVVDDNRSIHEDFRKILCALQSPSADLDATEASLFGAEPASPAGADFQIDSAFQGSEAIRMVEESVRRDQPYAVAFMDVRMPPGLDGIETTLEIWKRYPDLQVVLCTAYSDYSWGELLQRLGATDRLVILKKPFDNIEVLQLAHTLTEKWRLGQQARARMEDMERMVTLRTRELREANQLLQIEIAERKHAEAALRDSQQIILRQERLAAVGQLSAGVAHDFNNIMTIIHGHASLLLLNTSVPEPAHPQLMEIESAAIRAARLTRQLLAFSRKQVMQPQNLNLGEVAGNVTAMLSRALGEQIALRVAYPPTLPTVHADPGMIEQVLMNLAVNARDAMPDGGELSITVEAVEVDSEHRRRNPEACLGSYVRLTVRDTGCGMDAPTMGRMFEPFFTTKDVGKGTGLGLATVYGIIKQHQGWIEVQSAPGRGTVFAIFLPAGTAASAPAIRTARTARKETRFGQGETVLVVEDEPALRLLVRNIIERYGYSVVEAQSGREALHIWSNRKREIDLLLTDLVMPDGISGKDLAIRLLSDSPNLKIVFTSGYDRDPTETNPRLVEGHNFLRKPYSPSALAEIVHRSLQQQECGVAA